MTAGPDVVWSLGALLGEGPIWLAGEQALRFVDIKAARVHRFVPATGETGSLEVGGKPSFILPEASGGLIVGSEHGLYRLEEDGLGSCLVRIDQPVHNRTNDGTVDCKGRLWFGTMDDEQQRPTGALWCLDVRGLHHMGGDAVVTNGPAVSANGQCLYHVDSANRTIWRFGIGDGPAITSRDIFITLAEAEGYPDGVVLDADGCLWVALWDGWGVRRYSPEGELMLHIPFPCARVTKLTFGGRDLRTAYVTTARIGLDVSALAEQPLAGALFAFDAPVAGNPLPAVRL